MISLEALDRFKNWIGARPDLLKIGAPVVLFLVVLTPSIWMLSVVPPLWRGVDAYVQVAYPPGTGTLLQFGPLYSFAARIPLYVGYAMDSLRAGRPLPTLVFFIHPVLTDSGVFALLILQHVALCCSAFYLIILTSRLFWIRLALAITWAVNPLFYTFAHCVGSETLGMILLLLVGAVGLRIMRHPRKVLWEEWVLFGILVWLSILARHINATLAGLLPLTFLLLSAHHLIMLPFARSRLAGRWRRLRAKHAIQRATFAVTVGISCIVLANASSRVLCYAAQIPYYSTVGFTFLFRLKFLAGLPPEKRNELLDEVEKRTASEDVKKLISLLRNAFSTNQNWDVMAFMRKAQESLFTRQTDPQGQRFYLLLNRTEKVFLCPPNKVLLTAVARDFKRSQETTIPDVVRQVFASTTSLLSIPTVPPAYASLRTFRDSSPAQIMAVFKKHAYFRRPKDVSYRAFLFLWAANFALIIALARTRRLRVSVVGSYAAALTLVGLFMMVANCVLNVFQPRYTLPMWELTIVSASILSAKTLEYVFAGRSASQKQ